MSPFIAELMGTAILVLLGDGVVANVLLNKSKGQNSGWIVITTGWALAVTIAVYCVGSISGGHLNPAVTVAMASLGKLGWDLVPVYIGAQMAGAFLGAVLVWLAYLPHWEVTEDKGAKLGKIEGKVIAIADILGDWREEIITTVPGELRIYSTTIPATRRHVWLMEDPIYRNDVALVAMGYLYPPQLTKPMTAETKP